MEVLKGFINKSGWIIVNMYRGLVLPVCIKNQQSEQKYKLSSQFLHLFIFLKSMYQNICYE